MTAPQPPHESPTPHLDVDTLADDQEGLLSDKQAAAVAAHLAGCATCRETRDALDDVSTLLREHGAAGPSTAPDDVLGRLDAALAAAGTPVATASATVVPLRTPPVRSPWHTRALQAAAIFVLVAGVGGLGYGGVQALRGGGSSSLSSTASGAAGGDTSEKAAGAGKYRITNSGRNYSATSLQTALPELLAGSLPSIAADGAGALDAPADPGAAPYSAASPTPSGTSSPPPATAREADPGRLRNGAALAACVANLADGPVTPLAVDLGRFEGNPATIIVLPDPDDPAFVNVYAVAPACPPGTFLSWRHVALP